MPVCSVLLAFVAQSGEPLTNDQKVPSFYYQRKYEAPSVFSFINIMYSKNLILI